MDKRNEMLINAGGITFSMSDVLTVTDVDKRNSYFIRLKNDRTDIYIDNGKFPYSRFLYLWKEHKRSGKIIDKNYIAKDGYGDII